MELDTLATALKAVAAATWNDPDHRDWMADFVAILVVDGLVATQRRGAKAAAERIAFSFGQMVGPSEDADQDDVALFNRLANLLLDAFGVREAIRLAFLRMQKPNRDGGPFITPEHWDTWWTWMRSNFFPV
jgi:hypothetical protein